MIRIHRHAIPSDRLPAYEAAALDVSGKYLLLNPVDYARLAGPARAPRAEAPPTLRVRLANLWRALRVWTAAGFPMASQARYLRRRWTCARCPQWDPPTPLRLGRCRLCGCATELKLRLATEHCPGTPPRW